MKKTLTLIVLFVGIGACAFAQDNPTGEKKERERRGKFRHERVEKKSPEEMAKIRTERLDKKLHFTDEQRHEVYTYHLDQAQKISARSEELKKRRELRRNEMKADREKFKNMLTAEQREILANEVKAKRKKMMRERRDGERPMRRKKEKNPATKENTDS